jgi:glycerol-3-phosphate O-acyltransferase
MAAMPAESALKPAAQLARFIYTRSYERELDINQEALDRLHELSRDHLLLFLWSHKSHMDSFVFLLSLYDNGFKPLPLTFAGINMNFLGFGALARRVGAIFLRRSFQDDEIYKLVFRHYIDYLITNRIPLTWSIEGTRSRTGKLSPPRLGILNWVLEACERSDMHDVKVVPVSIAFDRIAEIEDYVSLQRGMPKRKESLAWFFNYVFGMKEPYGRVYVRYAEPLDLGHYLGGGVDATAPRGLSTAARVAFDTCTRIEQATPIKSADVLSMVLLGANGRALTGQEVFRRANEIATVIGERKLPTATGFSLDNEEQVQAAVLAMRRSKLIKRYARGSRPVYYIPEDQQLAAAYYRNTITHYFLAAALGEVALALSVDDITLPGRAGLQQRVDALRDLLKFEFFFSRREVFWEEVLQEVSRRYPRWESGEVSIQRQLRDQPPLFGHAILRSILEAYHVMASTLALREGKAVTDTRHFTSRLLDHGRELRLRKLIDSESSLSRDLFATGLKLAEYRGLLSGDAAELQRRRTDFARETTEALAAVNRLQASYDLAWHGGAMS